MQLDLVNSGINKNVAFLCDAVITILPKHRFVKLLRNQFVKHSWINDLNILDPEISSCLSINLTSIKLIQLTAQILMIGYRQKNEIV